MPREVFDPGALQRFVEDAIHVVPGVEGGLAGGAGEHVGDLQAARAGSEDVPPRIVHGHTPCFAVLRAGDGDAAGQEVHMLQAELELLGLTKPRMDGPSHHRPPALADGVAEDALLVLREEANALVVLPEEFELPNRIHLAEPVLHGHVEHVLEELEVAIDGRRGHAHGRLCDVPLDVTGENLPKRTAWKGTAEALRVPLVLPVTAKPAMDARQVVLEEIGQQHVTSPEALREEPPLLNLGLALLVHLDGQRLRADLLSVAPAVLVEEAHAPDTGALRVLVNAPMLLPLTRVVSVERAWHESRACRAIRRAAPRAPWRWPRRSRPRGDTSRHSAGPSCPASLRKGGGLVDVPRRGLVGANTENPH